MSTISGRRPTVLVLESTGRIGGGQKATLSLVSELREEFEFVVAVPAAGPMLDALQDLRVKTVVVPYPSPESKFSLWDRLTYLPRGLSALGRIRSLVAEYGAELIYSTSRSLLWATLAGRLTSTPVAVHLHMSPPTRATAFFLRRVASATPVRRVIVASPAIAERLRLESGKVVCVPNGVDASLFKVPVQAEYFDAISRPFARHTAAVVGELAPEKGQDDAIRALALLVRDGCDVGLRLVGAARTANSKYAEDLHSLADRLGVAERVEFTGHRDDVAEVLHQADLLLVPSKGAAGEACPLVVLEAWASGTPVAASSVGGIPAMLEGYRGETFAPSNPVSLAETWGRLLKHPERSDALSRAGLSASSGAYAMRNFRNRMREALLESLATEFQAACRFSSPASRRSSAS
jgi:glycosyltransferase involved in cell wall biosynthesis